MAAVFGGPQGAANAAVHPGSHGQLVGRCRVIFRAEVEIRAGMLMSLRRMVPLRALPRSAPAREPTAQAKDNKPTPPGTLPTSFPTWRDIDYPECCLWDLLRQRVKHVVWQQLDVRSDGGFEVCEREPHGRLDEGVASCFRR